MSVWNSVDTDTCAFDAAKFDTWTSVTFEIFSRALNLRKFEPVRLLLPSQKNGKRA